MRYATQAGAGGAGGGSVVSERSASEDGTLTLSSASGHQCSENINSYNERIMIPIGSEVRHCESDEC